MSQVYFKKEGMTNYMVIPFEGELAENYQNCLFQYHQVPYFLQYEVRQINGKQSLYYKLKYRTTLKSVLGHLQLTYSRLKNMITCIIGAMEIMEEYLLEQDGIMWKTDRIFIEADTGNLQFCYGLVKEEENCLKNLLTEIMQFVNRKDEESILLILQFYNILTEPECNLESLKSYVGNIVQETVFSQNRDSEYWEESNDFLSQQDEKQCRAEDSAKIWQNKSMTERQNKESEGEEEHKTLAERTVQILLFITAGINILLIGCLLFNVLTYDYIRYLFIGMGVLIVFTIIYMHVSKEETPDEMMQAFFEGNKEDFMREKNGTDNRIEDMNVKKPEERQEYMGIDKNYWSNGQDASICGETGVLISADMFKEEDKTAIVMEDYNKHLYLESIEKGKYDPICIKKQSVILGTMAEGCNYILMARGISRMHAKLMKKADGLYLLDLNSTNGTYLNGEMIESGQEYKLEEGDMVAFALSEFYVARERG